MLGVNDECRMGNFRYKMKGEKDFLPYDDIASYFGIVSFIRENSSSVNEDLEELYKSLVFNILIINTDDHLRNYVFICINNKLKLSKVYDLTPNIYNPTHLSLNIDEHNSDLSLELALSTYKYYGLDKDRAKR